MTDETKIAPRTPEVLRNPRMPAFDLSPREPHLYDYLLILRKHQWLILTFMLVVVTIVSVATFRMHPVYVATAKLEIDRESSNILPFQGADSYDYMMDTDTYIETQSRILTSETMALQTIRSDPADIEEFSSGGVVSEAIARGSLANQMRPPEVAAFLGSLSVKRIPSSRLMEVSFESTDPALAARILNEHLENFKEQNIQSRFTSTAEASAWLASQLSDLKLKVEKSENDRINYERQNQIWSLDNDKNDTTTQRLSDLNRQLTDAETETLKKRALYEYAESGAMDAVPQLRDNSLIQEMQRRRADLSVHTQKRSTSMVLTSRKFFAFRPR